MGALRGLTRRHGPAAALFLATALLSLRPLSSQPRGHLPDNADALSCAWSTAWVCHQLAHEPLRLLDANVFHPDRRTLLYQDPMIAPALLACPIWAATGSPTLAYNTLLVLTLLAAALAAYALAVELTGSRVAGLVAGEVFAFTTANYDSLARVQVLSTQWTPLTLLFLARLLRGGRLRDGLLAGLCFALQGLCSGYSALYFATLLLLVAPLFWFALPCPRRVPWLGSLAGLALALALLLPLARTQRDQFEGLDSARQLRVGALPGTSWLQALPGNLLYGRRLGSEKVGYDDRYFPGVLPPVLLVAGLALGAASRRRLDALAPAAEPAAALWLAILLAFGAAAFVLGCGRTVPLPGWGHVPGPYAWLHAHVPLYAVTRVPSRFANFARLGLAVGAAYGAVALLGRLRAGRPARLATAALLALALPLEHWSTPLRAWPVPEGQTLPAVYAWLRSLPESTPVLEFPPAPPRGRRAEALWPLLSTAHWMRLVNGYSSFQPPHHALVLDQLLDGFPSRGSLALLRRLGVQYLVVHPEWSRHFPESERALIRFESEVGRFEGDLRLVRRFSDAGAYDGPLGRLGGEEVWQLLPGRQTTRPAPLADATRLPPAGWSCDSKPKANCRLAIDADLTTAFSSGRGQRRGDSLQVDFGRPLVVGAVALRVGRWPAFYPRRPEVWGRPPEGWRRLAGRFDATAFLEGLLARRPSAGIEVAFEPVELTALRVRLGPTSATTERWMQAELEVYGPQAGGLGRAPRAAAQSME